MMPKETAYLKKDTAAFSLSWIVTELCRFLKDYTSLCMHYCRLTILKCFKDLIYLRIKWTEMVFALEKKVAANDKIFKMRVMLHKKASIANTMMILWAPLSEELCPRTSLGCRSWVERAGYSLDGWILAERTENQADRFVLISETVFSRRKCTF